MTGSTYIDYDKALNKGMKLIKSNDNPKFGLLIVCGINLGLRIDDLLSLTFDQLKQDTITIIEGKTKKKRTLKVNEAIKEALKHFEEEVTYQLGGKAFTSQKGSVYSSQHVNRLIKQYFGKGVSSHSLRKGFGRRVWMNDKQSERSLIYLSQLFNHSSTLVTRTYLGIQQEELNDIYMNL
ncbi:MAG: tyrosine-type recombinase/integrase [Aequorivita sp.]|nr:tyrosine-type recombinase/integrase [Aequorivita sp.]